ncbi:MAG: hypothetical protein V3V32_05350 [Dehalococcoidia bacterium]
MIRYVTALAVALVLLSGGITSANRLPDNRPQIAPWMECEVIKEEKVTVRFCKWGENTSLPREINMRELFAILSRDYMDDQDRLYSTVHIEPSIILGGTIRGVYLPATGDIVVAWPWDNDEAQFDHTVVHELLHALWDAQGVSMEQHHQRIYCQRVMEPLEAWIAQYDKNANRTWISGTQQFRHCGTVD